MSLVGSQNHYIWDKSEKMKKMKESRLNPTNSDHIIYTHPPMDIAVLGGIRLEGLDRMRVTLKVQVEHLSIRHNLDLYNDNQTEKLIRKIAERLEIGTSVAAAASTDLTDELEKYRLEELEKQTTEQVKKKFLTPEEIKAAKIYLSAPNLMERTKEGFCASEIREQRSIHPRTLNHYLNELTEFGRIRITGGNKHKGGYQYQFTGFTSDQHIQDELDKWIDTTLKAINQAHQKEQKSKRKPA